MQDGSHTNFDGAAFSAGAFSGAASLASAVAAGWANYRAAQRDRWVHWTAAQLQAALDCSEAMRFGLHTDLNKANARVAELERQIADRDFNFKRDMARRSRGQR